MKNITLESGLELSIDEGIMDDMELLDALCEVNEDNAYAVSKVCEKVFGKEEKKKLYDHLRKNGRVKTTEVVGAIVEVFGKMGEQGKN